MAKASKKKATSEVTALEEGKILDYITGKPLKDSAKEQVRQRIARALFHEYGISVDDMAPDFKLNVDGRHKKVDIAIFEAGTEHAAENLRRVVVCDKEPNHSKKGAFKMRDHKQAEKEFGLLHGAMAEAENCAYGLWTNGLEFFFFRREKTRFDVKYEPIGDWPMADESIGTRDVASNARMRRAEPEMLRIAFRRCHNFIHGNEGMPKDAAFWQFLPTFSAGEATRVVAPGHYVGGPFRSYDPSADGSRFLVVTRGEGDSAAEPATVVVVQDWIEELDQRAATP